MRPHSSAKQKPKQQPTAVLTENTGKKPTNSLLAEAQRARRRRGTAKRGKGRENPKSNNQEYAEKQPFLVSFSAPLRLRVLCEMVV
jgi:hypothetical protein